MNESREPLDPRLDSEALLLSSMMWSQNREQLTTVSEHVSPEDFYNPQYGHIFSVIIAFVQNGKPHDPAIVRSELRSRGNVDAINLAELEPVLLMLITLGAVPQAMLGYAAQVSSEAYRRQFRAMAQELVFASDHAPEAELFSIMVEHGKRQRAQWNNHRTFKNAAFNYSDVPEDGPEPKEKLEL